MNILKKYKSISAPVKASLWFTITSIVQKGISFFTLPLYTRMLEPEEYGAYTVFASWLGIVSIFATLNLHAGVFNNGMIKYDKDRDRYTSAMQGLSTTTTLILFILYLLTKTFVNEASGLSTVVIFLMFTQMLFSPAFLFWSARQRFEFKYVSLVAVTLFQALLTPALSLLLIFNMQQKENALIFGYVIAHVAISLIFYIRNFIKGKRFCVKKYWKFSLKFNLPLLPHYLSMIVLGQADRVMIERMIGKGEAGIYGLAYQLSLILNIVTSSVNGSFVPWTYQQLKAKEYKSIGKMANLLLILFFTLTLMIVLVAPEILVILAPAAYSEAKWIIPPVAISVFFTFLYTIFANIEFFFEENKFIMVASVIGAVVNIGLNYVLLPTMGYLSAGYTTLLCYVIFAVAHYAFMKKVLKKHANGAKVYNVKFIIMISLALILISFLFMALYELWYLRYGILLAIMVLLYIRRNDFINIFKQMRSK